MALISTLDIAGDTHQSYAGNVRLPVWQEKIIDYAAALTAKGSALAASDIIEVLNIPAGSVVLAAGAQVITAADSTTLTLHVDTGADNDEWVASLDGKAAAGTYGTDLDSVPTFNTYATADTIDLTFATLTGTLTTGKVRVYALILDVKTNKRTDNGLVQLGT